MSGWRCMDPFEFSNGRQFVCVLEKGHDGKHEAWSMGAEGCGSYIAGWAEGEGTILARDLKRLAQQ